MAQPDGADAERTGADRDGDRLAYRAMGPAGLSISTTGTMPSTALSAAITRQVRVCRPRTASSEVSQ